MSWLPMATAPKDGTPIRIKWRNAEDRGLWSEWSDPEAVWRNHPDATGRTGEWSTVFGNAERDEWEPLGWLPLNDDTGASA